MIDAETIAAALIQSRVDAAPRPTITTWSQVNATGAQGDIENSVVIKDFAKWHENHALESAEKGARTFSLARCEGGSADDVTSEVWGLLLDADRQADSAEELLAQLERAGQSYLHQRRTWTEGEKSHTLVFFDRPILTTPPSSAPLVKEKYISMMRHVLSRFGELGAISLDPAMANAYASKIYPYTRRASDPSDLVIHTEYFEGGSLDVEAFARATGWSYETTALTRRPDAAPARPAEDPVKLAMTAAITFSKGDNRAIAERRPLLLTGAAGEPGRWERLMRAITWLVRQTIEYVIFCDGLEAATSLVDDPEFGDAVETWLDPVVEAMRAGGAPPQKPWEHSLDKVRQSLINGAIRKAVGHAETVAPEILARKKSSAADDKWKKKWETGGAGALVTIPSAIASDRTEEFHVPPLPEWDAGSQSPKRGPLVFFRGCKEKDHGAISYVNAEGETKWIRQEQPNQEQLAEAAPTLIHYLNHLVIIKPSMGNRVFAVSDSAPANIATPSSEDSLIAAVAKLVRAMMGGTEPIPSAVKTATEIVEQRPFPDRLLAPIRWQGETHLAVHEIPTPKEGDWSAHKEFVDRASCQNTLMAWVWSCFLSEDQTGREALFLYGAGNDGKSEWCRALMATFGPSATSSEILKGENRFELANLVDKRLVYFGDFRNPRPIHSKLMREIISGANLSFEFKGKDMASAYFHPRCLLSTNVEPRIRVNDSAERTRVRRINISPLDGNKGDRSWPRRLIEQMPAFLFECRKVWQSFAIPGQDLPYTQACLDALAGGKEDLDEEFEALAARIEITGKEEDFITIRQLSDIFEKIRYFDEWKKKDARKWMRDGGAQDRHSNGNKIQRRIQGTVTNIWTGVKKIDESPFDGVSKVRVK